MVSLMRLISHKVIRMNSHKFVNVFAFECHALNKFLQMRNSVVFRKNHHMNLLNKKIIFRKCSTKTSQLSGVSRPSGVHNQVEDDRIEREDEDEHYERCKDDDFDDVDNDDDDDDDDDEDDDDDDVDIDVDEIDLEIQEHGIKRSTNEIFEEISQGDPEVLKKLKLLEFELAVLKEQGNRVINNPSKSQWEELLKNANISLSRRIKLLSYMALNEKLMLYNLKKKKVKSMKKKKKKVEAGFHYYGLSGHTMFPVVLDKSINKLVALRHLMAKQKILLDCSYEEFMNETFTKFLAKQISMSITEVRTHQYRCQLALCNLSENDRLGKILPKYVQQIFDESFYCDVSAQSPLDLYPKDKLVYLSPHAPNDLLEFSKENIYVIGAFVDKGTNMKASLAKAKRDQIRVARLPIDPYLIWKQGSKSLPINIVVKILLDMSFYNDWSIALKCIANRSRNDSFSRRRLYISDKVEEL